MTGEGRLKRSRSDSEMPSGELRTGATYKKTGVRQEWSGAKRTYPIIVPREISVAPSIYRDCFCQNDGYGRDSD